MTLHTMRILYACQSCGLSCTEPVQCRCGCVSFDKTGVRTDGSEAAAREQRTVVPLPVSITANKVTRV